MYTSWIFSTSLESFLDFLEAFSSVLLSSVFEEARLVYFLFLRGSSSGVFAVLASLSGCAASGTVSSEVSIPSFLVSADVFSSFASSLAASSLEITTFSS